MVNIFIVAVALLAVALFPFHLMILLEWDVHTSIRKGKTFGWASYNKFMKHFNQYQWELSDISGLLVTKDRLCLISEYRIQINEKLMIINNPYSFFLVQLFIKKYIRNQESKREERITW